MSSDGDSTACEEFLIQKQEVYVQQRPFWKRHIVAVCAHFAFLSANTILILVLLFSKSGFRSCESKANEITVHSPAEEALSYHLEMFNSGDGHVSPYSGYPSPELDKNWEDLLGRMNVRLSSQDLEAVGREHNAVRLADGSGYVGTLSVYHEIHCVKWLHKHMYQEYYWPNLDDEQRELNRLHSEHCLNALRKTAMCHGDVTLITYNWAMDDESSKPQASATEHKCVDWQKLIDWTDQRTVNMTAPGVLESPPSRR